METSAELSRPRISLLVCTVGRTGEVARLLASLQEQTYRGFEVIVVDQNDDDRLGAVLAPFSESLSLHRISSARGLSRARNEGMPHCNGEIIGLPDDDCWYPPDLLSKVVRLFEEDPQLGFVTGRWQDECGRDGFGGWPERGEAVTVEHIWTRAISFTIFFRRAVMLRTGPFDERLGVGAGTPWGAGEETDYLLRALSTGAKGWHEPACIVRHPKVISAYDERALSRARAYARGTGFVLRKHRCGGRRIARSLLRPLAGAIGAAALMHWRKVRYYLRVFEGRWIGIFCDGADG